MNIKMLKDNYLKFFSTTKLKSFLCCYEYRISKIANIAIASSGIWKKSLVCYLKKRGIYIGLNVKCGNDLYMPHPINIIIGEKTVIGNNVKIFQGVTIGKKNGKYPRIGNNVQIFPNSVILGNITIGDNVVIGAGSVVLKSIAPNKIVAGVPAREISKCDNIKKL